MTDGGRLSCSTPTGLLSRLNAASATRFFGPPAQEDGLTNTAEARATGPLNLRDADGRPLPVEQLPTPASAARGGVSRRRRGYPYRSRTHDGRENGPSAYNRWTAESMRRGRFVGAVGVGRGDVTELQSASRQRWPSRSASSRTLVEHSPRYHSPL